jgi:mono/diheme cytochrome c family protein
MPAWGAAYLGPLNDFEVQSMVDYILALQTGEIPDAQAFTGAMASGEAVWMNNCATCHAPDLSGRVGPQLLNFYERYGWTPGNDAIRAAVDNTLRGTIVNGRYVPGAGIMPPFQHVLTRRRHRRRHPVHLRTAGHRRTALRPDWRRPRP